MSGTPLVILCTCYDTLHRELSPKALESEIASRRPGARVEFVSSLCRESDLDDLAGRFEKERPEGVLLAACSLFARGRAVLDGLNERRCTPPVALVDVREGCALIHSGDPEGHAAKVADLVCMGLAGLARGERSVRPPFHAERRVLVIGAGPAGLAAAGTLAKLGIPVTLTDRLGRPGGLLNQIGRLFPDNISSEEFLTPLLSDAALPSVEFLPKSTVTRIDGDPGQFEAHVTCDGKELISKAGAIVLACGALPVLPENRFRSGELPGVVSQLELETRLKKLEAKDAAPPEMENAVFIQCVAARTDDRPYCSTICCPTALKNALRLKNLKPDVGVTVLHRGIMTPGRSMEELYRRAMAAGVRFVAYSPADPPEVKGNGKVSGVALIDALSGRSLELPADLVVLSTPLKPRPETSRPAESLGLRLDNMGFPCGCEPMQPLVAPVPGVYLCGAVRWPVYAQQAVDQGRAAAVKAAGFLRHGTPGVVDATVASLPGTSSIRTEACSRCGQCVAVCPYGACRRGTDGAVSVSVFRCRGCGLCTAVCPSGAARIPEHNHSLLAMVREIAPRIAP